MTPGDTRTLMAMATKLRNLASSHVITEPIDVAMRIEPNGAFEIDVKVNKKVAIHFSAHEEGKREEEI